MQNALLNLHRLTIGRVRAVRGIMEMGQFVRMSTNVMTIVSRTIVTSVLDALIQMAPSHASAIGGLTQGRAQKVLAN